MRDPPVSLIDLAPTILAAVGEDPYNWSDDLPGRSLFEIAEAALRSAAHCLFRVPRVRIAVRRLHAAQRALQVQLYVGYQPELFDLVEDPNEELDLAASTAHADLVARL